MPTGNILCCRRKRGGSMTRKRCCTSAARTWILALDAVAIAFAGDSAAPADEVATMRQCVANSL